MVEHRQRSHEMEKHYKISEQVEDESGNSMQRQKETKSNVYNVVCLYKLIMFPLFFILNVVTWLRNTIKQTNGDEMQDRCIGDGYSCGKFEGEQSKFSLNDSKPKLDDRVDSWKDRLDDDLRNERAKEFEFNEMLGACGTRDFSIKEFSKWAFETWYKRLAQFDGIQPVGLVSVPKTIIEKHWILLEPLEPDKQEEALAAARKDGAKKDKSKVAKKDRKKNAASLMKAAIEERNQGGLQAERNAFEGGKSVFSNALCTLFLHSLSLLKPTLEGKKGENLIEIDGLALHFDTATVFVIEAKKSLRQKTCKHAYDQVKTIKKYFEEWFGADICDLWTFKPIFYFESNDDKLKVCDSCLKKKVAIGKQHLMQIIHDHIDERQNNFQITDSNRQRLVEDFKVMARYLIFGVSAKELDTTSVFARKTGEYMENVGCWMSIKLWCFLIPEQMDVLSADNIIFYSGFGGGKTIAATEACKMWAENGAKVLILVNGYRTFEQTMILVHDLRMKLKEFPNIDVQQIDFDNISLEELKEISKRYNCMFIDEFPGDTGTLEDRNFKEKIVVLIHGKDKVWVAVSNFDKLNKDTDVSGNLKVLFPDHKIKTFLIKNMRNPIHIKKLMDKIQWTTNEEGQDLICKTMSYLNRKMVSPPNVQANLSLNEKMVSPTNMQANIDEDPVIVLNHVFVKKTMKAVIVSSKIEDAKIFSDILRHIYQCPNICLVKESAPNEIGELVKNWINWIRNSTDSTPNILVTWKPMVNGSDTGVVINVDAQDLLLDNAQSDCASRATNQYIRPRDFIAFLLQCKALSVKNVGWFEVYGDGIKTHLPEPNNGRYLIEMILNHASDTEQTSKEDFVMAVDHCSGLMNILFKAAAHFNLCFHISSEPDPEFDQMKKICLCSGVHHENEETCARPLQLTCSLTDNFLLFLNDQDTNGKQISLQSFWDPEMLFYKTQDQMDWQFNEKFTVHPKSTENELHVTNHDYQSLLEAIKQIHNDGDPIFYYCESTLFNFCKALHQRLSLGELRNDHIFTKSQNIKDFLENNVEKCTLVDFSRDHLISSSHESVTHFRYPLDVYERDGRIVLDVMSDNPKLYDFCFQRRIKHHQSHLLDLDSFLDQIQKGIEDGLIDRAAFLDNTFVKQRIEESKDDYPDDPLLELVQAFKITEETQNHPCS